MVKRFPDNLLMSNKQHTQNKGFALLRFVLKQQIILLVFANVKLVH